MGWLAGGSKNEKNRLRAQSFLALLAFAAPANAISFTGTFNITSDAATDPSLVIQTNPTLGTNSPPINFNLTTVNRSTPVQDDAGIGDHQLRQNPVAFAHATRGLAGLTKHLGIFSFDVR